MYGFEVEQAQGSSRHYRHLTITIYHDDKYDGEWAEFAQFEWQADEDNWHDWGWYAAKFNSYYGKCDKGFNHFLKFGKRVEKGGMFSNSPENVYDWLCTMRGMVELVTDNRLKKLVSREKAIKDQDKLSYEVIRQQDGRVIATILAYDEMEACNKVMKRAIDEQWYGRSIMVSGGIKAEEMKETRYSKKPDLSNFEEKSAAKWD